MSQKTHRFRFARLRHTAIISVGVNMRSVVKEMPKTVVIIH